MSRDKGSIEIVDEIILTPSHTIRESSSLSQVNGRDEENLSSAIKASKWRYSFYIFNSIVAIFAVILIIVMFRLDSNWSCFEPFLQVFIAVPGVSVIILSFGLIILNLYGYYVICRHCHSHYVWFAIFLCILLVYEVRIIATGLIYNRVSEDYVAKTIDVAMEKYKNSTHYWSSVNYMQITLQCCGKVNYSDWLSTSLQYIPPSCCQKDSADARCDVVEDKSTLFQDGCLNKLLQIPILGLHILYCSLGVLLTVKVLFLVTACKLASLLDNVRR